MTFLKARIPRVVPWADHSEWMVVYKQLFPVNIERAVQLRAGIKRVKSWQARGNLPLAIEATSSLIEIVMLEEEQKLPESALRHLYAMAVVRFVNGMVDQQQKGAFAQSVMQLAQSIQIPLYLVDIRHAATHESLPSLSLLRKACQDSLAWLETNYWEPQSNFELSAKEAYHKLLDQYKALRKKEIRTSSLKTDVPLGADSQKIVKELIDSCPEDLIRLVAIPCLLTEGRLVPIQKQKRVLTKDESLPNELLELWFPVISAMSHSWSGFKEDLFEEIILLAHEQQIAAFTKRLEFDECSFLATLAHWAAYLCQEISREGQEANSVLSQCRAIVSGKPTVFYTPFIIERISKLLGEEFLQPNAELPSNSFHEVDLGRIEDHLEQLKTHVASRNPRAITGEKRKFGIWEECAPEDWSESTAIGALPASIAKKMRISGTKASWCRLGKPVLVHEISIDGEAIIPMFE